MSEVEFWYEILGERDSILPTDYELAIEELWHQLRKQNMHNN